MHIQVHTPNQARQSVFVDRIPDMCPRCHRGIDARIHFATEEDLPPGIPVQILFQCPLSDCSRFFIGIYNVIMSVDNGIPGKTNKLTAVVPNRPRVPSIREEVSNVSSNFVSIFTQAYQAEGMGLHEVVGISLRKALEFLIKDYLIQEHPDKEDDIKKRPLESCIKNFITDTPLRECARRAVWLGNDETHYTRRWLDKDITDLKILIEITMNWIGTAVLTKKYLADMSLE